MYQQCLVSGQLFGSRRLLWHNASARLCSLSVTDLLLSDNYISEFSFRGKSYQLAIWDTSGTTPCAITLPDCSHTAGLDEYIRLRYLSYTGTQVFILLYSVADRGSFENVRSRWVSEVKERNGCPTLVLVATKIDLRASGDISEKDFISTAEVRSFPFPFVWSRYL